MHLPLWRSDSRQYFVDGLAAGDLARRVAQNPYASHGMFYFSFMVLLSGFGAVLPYRDWSRAPLPGLD